MNKWLKALTIFLALTTAIAAETPADRDTNNQQDVRQNKPDLEQRVEILEEELQKARMQEATRTYQSAEGMAPAASQIYHTQPGSLTFGGYAEAYGTSYNSRYKNGTADVERFILYSAYRFNDWILFNAELEFEHAGFEQVTVVTDVDFAAREATQEKAEKNEISVEFAYLDFEFSRALQLRLGLNLVPIGITNYMHEPTTFYSVRRPISETTIIPSTWRELGLLLHGELADGTIQYKTGIMTGLDGTRFSAGDWIGEDGSYRGSQATLRDLAFVANVEWVPLSGLTLGSTYFVGGAGQGNVSRVNDSQRLFVPTYQDLGLDDQAASDLQALQRNNQQLTPVTVHIAEGHALYRTGPWDFRALFVKGWMNDEDTRSLNSATGENIGRVAQGGYLEVAFNLLSFTSTEQRLMLFLRGEKVNTQKETAQRYAGGKEDILDAFCSSTASCKTTDQLANGNQDLGVIQAEDAGREAYGVNGLPDKTNDRSIATIGLAYFPHPNVVVKLEYARADSASTYYRDTEFLNPDNNKVDHINFGFGFIF